MKSCYELMVGRNKSPFQCFAAERRNRKDSFAAVDDPKVNRNVALCFFNSKLAEIIDDVPVISFKHFEKILFGKVINGDVRGLCSSCLSVSLTQHLGVSLQQGF